MRLSIVLISFFICSVLAGQSLGALKSGNKYQKKRQKFIAKRYKTKVKELQQQGYKVYASSKTLGAVLFDHDYKLNPGMLSGEEKPSDYEREIVVTVENCPNPNLCVRKGLADASTEYAQRTSSFVRGKVISEQRLNVNPNDPKKLSKDNIDKFGQAFEQLVGAKVNDVLRDSYALISDKGKGYKYEVHYLIEKKTARLAREAAY